MRKYFMSDTQKLLWSIGRASGSGLTDLGSNPAHTIILLQVVDPRAAVRIHCCSGVVGSGSLEAKDVVLRFRPNI